MTTTVQPGPATAKRAAFYLRVSTGRQAEQDLSIPISAAKRRRTARPAATKRLANTSSPGLQRRMIDVLSFKR